MDLKKDPDLAAAIPRQGVQGWPPSSTKTSTGIREPSLVLIALVSRRLPSRHRKASRRSSGRPGGERGALFS